MGKNLFILLCLAVTLACSAQPQLVKDIRPSFAGAFDFSSPHPAALNGKLIFVADDGTHGPELWISDGTEGGTFLLKDINPGTTAYIKDLTTAGNFVFFAANDGVHGEEIWRTDGTTAGTMMIKDLNPADEYGFLPNMPGQKTLAIGNLFYYIGIDGNSLGLYVTNGTIGNTTLLLSNADLKELVANWNGKAIFTRYRENGNYEADIWQSDGTVAGTQKIQSFAVTPSGTPILFRPADNQLYFVVSTLAEGYEIWVTDGTAGGTHIVNDTAPGTLDGFNPEFPNLTVFQGHIWFIASPDGALTQELWQSDGSAAGTFQVKVLPDRYSGFYPPPPTAMAVLSDKLIFSVSFPYSSELDLWISDGTTAGTIKKLNPNGMAVNPLNFYPFGGRMFFSGYSVYGAELWQCDGTSANRSSDLAAGPGSSSPNSFTGIGNILYFIAYGTYVGTELYRYDVPTVDVKETDPAAISALYPNPAATTITVATSDQTGANQILRIYDVEGRLVWSQLINAGLTTVAVEDFANGLYAMQIGSAVQKFMIQH